MTEYFTKEGDDFKPVEGELFNQEGVDKIVKDRAERVARQQFGDYDELKVKATKVDTIKSEYETKLGEANTTIGTLTKERDEAKLGTEKVKVMHEFKLPEDMAEFVTGKDVDELRAKAEKLSKGVGTGKVNLKKEEKPKDGKTGSDSKSLVGGLFGKKSDD